MEMCAIFFFQKEIGKKMKWSDLLKKKTKGERKAENVVESTSPKPLPREARVHDVVEETQMEKKVQPVAKKKLELESEPKECESEVKRLELPERKLESDMKKLESDMRKLESDMESNVKRIEMDKSYQVEFPPLSLANASQERKSKHKKCSCYICFAPRACPICSVCAVCSLEVCSHEVDPHEVDPPFENIPLETDGGACHKGSPMEACQRGSPMEACQRGSPMESAEFPHMKTVELDSELENESEFILIDGNEFVVLA